MNVGYRLGKAGDGQARRASNHLLIIYYWAPAERAFYMLYAYSKNEQGDVTPAQARQLGRLVREEFK